MKKDMKQTVEEAAKKYSNDCRNRQLHCEPYCIVDFISGAEWQSKQSPWISVNERLPEAFEPNLILLKDGQVRVASLDFQITCFWYDREADESFDLEDVVAFMPIPSFDDILEANRDVLERIKEKGD